MPPDGEDRRTPAPQKQAQRRQPNDDEPDIVNQTLAR
jgi:hypothetical protein